jgi:hypothetical protein
VPAKLLAEFLKVNLYGKKILHDGLQKH